MIASGTYRPRCRSAMTCAMVMAFCVSLLAWPVSEAQAQRRGVGIGLGVAGGLSVLNELSKVGTTKKGKSSKSSASGKSSKKKTYGSKSKGSGSSTAKKDDDDSGTTGKADESAEESASTTATGSVDAARQPTPAAVQSAPSGTAALAATGVAATAASDAKTISSKSEIKSAQEHLKYMGYDVPELNGTLDLKTKIAVMQFQDSIGAESTGNLTVKQLQTLFVKVAEKTAKAK